MVSYYRAERCFPNGRIDVARHDALPADFLEGEVERTDAAKQVHERETVVHIYIYVTFFYIDFFTSGVTDAHQTHGATTADV